MATMDNCVTDNRPILQSGEYLCSAARKMANSGCACDVCAVLWCRFDCAGPVKRTPFAGARSVLCMRKPVCDVRRRRDTTTGPRKFLPRFSLRFNRLMLIYGFSCISRITLFNCEILEPGPLSKCRRGMKITRRIESAPATKGGISFVCFCFNFCAFIFFSLSPSRCSSCANAWRTRR